MAQMLGVARLIIFKRVECTGQLENTKGFIDRNSKKTKVEDLEILSLVWKNSP